MERSVEIESRPGDWTCSTCEHHNFARREVCRNCSTSKTGEKAAHKDWVCSGCSFNNFGRNRACIKCGHMNVPGGGSSPTSPSPSQVTVKPGDWVCPCGEMVFASRFACRRCGARKPTPAGYGASPYDRPSFGYAEVPAYGAYPSYPPAYGSSYLPAGGPVSRPGDWTCSCGELVFASRDSCRRCGKGKPSSPPPSSYYPIAAPSYGKPGDWVCPCGELVFASRPACRRCGTTRPPANGGGVASHPNMKPGDWVCKDCGDLQFASRTACRRCGAAKKE